MNGRARALVALLVFVGWALVSAFGHDLWQTEMARQSLNDSISGAVQPGLAAAIVFLLIVVAAFRWTDVGLNLPRPWSSLRLLWFPLIYVVFFAAADLFVGLPPAPVALVVAANTVMAGVSEELACRGILFQGMRAWLPAWPAILVSTGLFGAVHVLNGFGTGDFLAASVQAVAAFMTGIAFMAIRLRTGSLYPGIILHAVWDFTLAVLAVSLARRLGEGAPPTAASLGLAMLALPLLFIAPNFLYGLFLLRRAGRDDYSAIRRANSVS